MKCDKVYERMSAFNVKSVIYSIHVVIEWFPGPLHAAGVRQKNGENVIRRLVLACLILCVIFCAGGPIEQHAYGVRVLDSLALQGEKPPRA